MTDSAVPPTAHQDNLLGICHAVGTDLGIDPVWFRLGLGALLLVSLTLPFVIYGVLGLIVLVSRLIVRSRIARSTAEVTRLDLGSRGVRPANDQAAHAEAA